MSYLTCFCVFF